MPALTNLVLALLLLLITGCATKQGQLPCDPGRPQAQRALRANSQKSWTLEGVISLTQRNTRNTAHFTWHQAGPNYTITLTGPLNLQQLQIIGKAHLVQLIQADRSILTASTPEELLARNFGWQLPVTPLQYWLRNLPAPKTPFISHLDRCGHLVGLKQAGWQIEYGQFTAATAEVIPKLITLKHRGLLIKVKLSKIK